MKRIAIIPAQPGGVPPHLFGRRDVTAVRNDEWARRLRFAYCWRTELYRRRCPCSQCSESRRFVAYLKRTILAIAKMRRSFGYKP